MFLGNEAKELISDISDLNHGVHYFFKAAVSVRLLKNILPLLYVIAVVVFWVHNE